MTPCLNCKNRELKCHGKCELYKAFKELKDSERQYNKELKQKLKDIESITKGYLI